MAKTACRPAASIIKDLWPQRQNCPACGRRMWLDYTNDRTLVTLTGCIQLNLAIRRCHHRGCDRRLRPYRPESEGRFALPKHEFGLDVIALVGTLRYAELLAVALSDDRRLKKLLAGQGRVLVAIDGLQPDVGHEVLWVLRDCLSGEVLLAKSLLSATTKDLSALLQEVREALPVPITGVV